MTQLAGKVLRPYGSTDLTSMPRTVPEVAPETPPASEVTRLASDLMRPSSPSSSLPSVPEERPLPDPGLASRRPARALAARVETGAATGPEERVRLLYRLAYQREPTPHQLASALALVEAAGAEGVAGPSSTASVRAASPSWRRAAC